MNIVVRNMIYADIAELSRAFAGQGWVMPPQVYEGYYNRMLRHYCDLLVAEVRGCPAGFARLEWVDAGEESGHALLPELQEFILLNHFTGTGVSEVLNAELQRRIAAKTGEAENTMMAIYGEPELRPLLKSSYVLDGLLVGNDGKFIRSRGTGAKGVRLMQKSSR